MEKGRVVIFAAGTGNPFFTTDTAAALRAAEMHCDALLKGTQVDGVYSADPRKVADASRYEQLTYHEVLANDLGVMDAAAISLARENAAAHRGLQHPREPAPSPLWFVARAASLGSSNSHKTPGTTSGRPPWRKPMSTSSNRT